MYLNIIYDDNKVYKNSFTLEDINTTTFSIVNLNSLQDELIKYNVTTNKIITRVDIIINQRVSKINELNNILNLFENPCLCINNIGFEETINLLTKLKFKNIKVKTIYSADAEEDLIEVLKAYKYIARVGKYIKSFNLSPLEEVILLYDLLKEREYKESKESADSRSLMRVYKNNEIVCLGFSNIVGPILDFLHIKNELLYYKSNNRKGHVDNLIYINDSKYDLHTSFIVDLAWTCKGSYENRKYKYNYFYKTIQSDIKDKRKRNLVLDYEANKYSMFGKIYYGCMQLDENIVSKNYDFIFNIKICKLLESMLEYSKIVGNQDYIDEILFYKNSINDYTDHDLLEDIDLFISDFVENEFSHQMLLTTFYQLLGNERRILIGIDSEKYEFEVENIIGDFPHKEILEEAFFEGFNSKKIKTITKTKNPLLPQDL